jgi:hypothetical protein
VAGLNHSLHGEGGDCPHCPEFKTIEGNRGYWGNLESSGNLLDNMAYDIANSAYLTAQVFDFELLGKDYSNPITGSRAFTYLDGSPEYNPGNVVLSAASLAPVSKVIKYGENFIKNSTSSIVSSRTFRKNILSFSNKNKGGKVVTLFGRLKYVGNRSSSHGSKMGYSKSIKIRWGNKDYHIFDW